MNNNILPILCLIIFSVENIGVYHLCTLLIYGWEKLKKKLWVPHIERFHRASNNIYDDDKNIFNFLSKGILWVLHIASLHWAGQKKTLKKLEKQKDKKWSKSWKISEFLTLQVSTEPVRSFFVRLNILGGHIKIFKYQH